MSNVEVKKIIKDYAEKLTAEKFNFFAIYLFGSCAKGKANKNSDIDIAVISDEFKCNWNKNEDKLWRYAFNIDSRIEPIGFSSADFKDNGNPIVYEIKKTGIRVV